MMLVVVIELNVEPERYVHLARSSGTVETVTSYTSLDNREIAFDLFEEYREMFV